MSKKKREKAVFRKREHGWIRFHEGVSPIDGRPDGWSMSDPEYGPLNEAAHTARYDLARLTQTQAYLLCEVVGSYHHLMTHPCGTEYAISQLRAVRRALAADIPDTTPEKKTA
jgi:hypothetical protein